MGVQKAIVKLNLLGMRSLISAFFLLCCGSGLSAFAQQPRATIPYVSSPLRIDGSSDDWASDPNVEYVQENPVATNANRMVVRLAWDEHSLYLLAEVYDQQIVQLTHDPARIYLNDAVELFIDPLDDSENRMDINDYQFIVDHTGAATVLKGEKALILDSTSLAPKEAGISTVAYQYAAQRMPESQGVTVGYIVELALPFAGLGVMPRAGSRLKLDFCVDDLDSLVDLAGIPEGGHLPGFFASNWDGYSDFSFPDHWRTFALAGGPSMSIRISRDLLPYWLFIVLGLVCVAGLVIGWQAYRIAQLKDVLPRHAVRPGLMHTLERMATELPATQAQETQLTNEMAQDAATEQQRPGRPDLGTAESPLHPQIARCRDFVLAQLDQDLKMEDLASECALSLRSLQRIFKEELDMSPGNFVVLLKMEHAAELLRGGRCNVSEAAWQLGYQDSSYFSRVFKKYHGVSPKSMLAA